MKKSLYLILFVIVFTACNTTGEKTVKRPRETWVFRSVLDEKPRMITVALNKELWAAYDAQNSELYKVWKGGVNFNGAVYTTVHGPQPTTKGYAYYADSSRSEKWIVTDNKTSYVPQIEYKGYEIIKNKAFILYELTLKNGDKVSVKENPEYIKRGNQNGLSRSFIVDDLPENLTIGLKLSITSLADKKHFRVVDGTFEEESTIEDKFDEGIIYAVKGVLQLSTESPTELRIFYHPGFDADEKGNESNVIKYAKGNKLIKESDCSACHNEKVKTVGPSYISIAEKYNEDETTIDGLASKIINGGQGVWGQAMMTAHYDLSNENAIEMVKYILSLDDHKQKLKQTNVERKASLIRVKDKFEPNEGKGLATHLYLMNDVQKNVKTIIENSQPIRSGVTSALHALSVSDLPIPGMQIALEFSGQIEIPNDGSYDFRLTSDDGSYLFIDQKEIIDNSGLHGARTIDGEVYLSKGFHDIKVLYGQGAGGAELSFKWFDKEKNAFVVVEEDFLSHSKEDFKETRLYIPPEELVKSIPGDILPLNSVHPSFDLYQARPDDLQPKIGGIDFMDDGRMVFCTWDSLGQVYLVENYLSDNPSDIVYKKIASGLAEPLGIKVVDNEIYVLQKQELTKLIDQDNDEIIDTFQKISDGWKVSANFHEFAFGLVYQDGYFYGTLATAILPGGASASPQISDRGKVIKINKESGDVEFIAKGLRTPNGIGVGINNQLFVADNQGDWLPASKIVHVQNDAFYGSRSVDPIDSENWEEINPLVWLPQDEIGNSPSEPALLNIGPYKQQMIHGEVTHGGLKRVFVEEINGNYQGAVFRFTQGLEAGVNRIDWAPDGKSIIIGGIGSSGNWGHAGKLGYGLQRLTYNGKKVFDMLAVRAKTNGIEVEFTQPIKDGQYINKEDFLFKQWYYQPTKNYGGPKLNEEKLTINNFYISEDRKKIFFELPEIKEEHVVYLRVLNPPVGEGELSLWTTEAWYTLNSIPKNDKGFENNYQVKHNSLSDSEEANGWKLLFDGKTLSGLRNFGKKDLNKAWVVQNGTLHLAKKNGGDIVITDKEYQDFELYLEWKISKGGNSGIIYNALENEDFGYPWMTGPEMQILDNEGHSDGQFVKHRAGDLYDMIKSKYVTVNEPEEWNRIRIISKEGKIQHWQNGHQIVSFEIGNESWKQLIENSKFKGWKGFGAYNKGHIALQDHGDKVWFRNIKIREL